MSKTIFIIRIFFIALSLSGAWLIWYTNPDFEDYLPRILIIGGLLGVFTVLVDIFLKGFSLRGLTALTFGLLMGLVIAMLISASPLFEQGDPEVLFMSRLVLFIVCMYLGTVIALRGKDEFNLVIPYVRFLPQKVDSPVIVMDASALIDGRIVGVCGSRFLLGEIVIPRFVLDELQRIADSTDPARKAKGRKGLQVLNELKKLDGVHITIQESDLGQRHQMDAKLIFLAKSLNAKLLTTDYNLAKLAEFQGVEWLNLSGLAKALNAEITVGERFDVELVRPGKDTGQAVGFLSDGSMVVVTDAEDFIGQSIHVEAVSIIPSAGGKMVFARLAR